MYIWVERTVIMQLFRKKFGSQTCKYEVNPVQMLVILPGYKGDRFIQPLDSDVFQGNHRGRRGLGPRRGGQQQQSKLESVISFTRVPHSLLIYFSLQVAVRL